MRIGLNLLYLLPGIVGGTETYAAGLLHGLAKAGGRHHFLVFVNAESTFWPLPKSSNVQRIACPVRAVSRLQRLAYEQFALPGLARCHRLDLLHSLGYVAPLRLPCPSVVTIHDMNTRGHGRSMGLLKRLLLAILVSRSARRASLVVTVSDFSRQEIMTHLRLPSHKIATILEAPPPEDGLALHAGNPAIPTIPKPFILAFASLSPHKNIPRLIEALALLARSIPHQLVLAGHIPTDGRIHKAISAHGMANRVTLTGWLPRPSVQTLLAEAEAFVFPSLYEGFGLPALEAQAQNTVVVCSRRGALPEVAGDGAVFFDPRSARDMADKIRLCLTDVDLRQRLRLNGARNLARFSWTRAAHETLAVYERAAGRRTRP